MATSPSAVFVVPSATHRRERWRNGLGWTREIWRHPDVDAWDWRISIADIEQDAPFSTFPGIERELVLLSGNGLRLCFDDGEVQALEPPHGRLRFDGARGVRCELPDGPTQDFNLMWRRDVVAAELWHRPLVGPMVIFVEPRTTWLVHLVAGVAHCGGDAGLPALVSGETAVLQGAEARTRHVLDGGGSALLIRLQPIDRGRGGD